MQSRFASVKRPILALAALATLIVATGLTPARAVSHNNLSAPGTTGKIRVRPQFQDRTGATKLQAGDPKDASTNPNRTVGDVPKLPGDLNPSPCTPAPADCLRLAGNNDAAVNASAADGHTHYHVGDTTLIVNEVAGFRAGDTIQIGSPHCNYVSLGLTCKKFIPGFGLVNEQPTGEVATVVGGHVGIDDHGVGVLELASGLTLEHIEGSQIVKLATGYQGQQFRVDIPQVDLLNCDLLFSTCNTNSVEVRAWFLPPQGSHDPAFARRPLFLNRDGKSFSALVPAACGIPGGCGAGFFSFYIPKEITGTGTIGKTFSVDTPDTWYTVIVTATDVVTGGLVADGVQRFKLNPAAITELKAVADPRSGRTEAFPMESIEITGAVRDNTSAIGLARRPAEDIIVDVKVTQPSGSSSTFQTNSCVDTDPTPADVCGGGLLGENPDGHGKFIITYGGPQGVFLSLGLTTTGPKSPTCNDESSLFGLIPCAGAVFTMMDTFDTGTYDVLASLRGYKPAATASTSFDVVLL